MADSHSTNRSIGASFASAYAIQQQTFLGCSISSFSTTAGFGDAASQLSVELAVDDFNNGDGTIIGLGHDVYHDGAGDNFRPPPVGSPVFFTFGRLRADIDEAFRKTYDDYYGLSTSIKPTVDWSEGVNFGQVTAGNKGHDHFAFGGILQAYTQNTDSTGGTRYSVTVTDPRDILGNCILILNNYAGGTFNNNNLINIYGFLEHDVKDQALYKEFTTPKNAAGGVGADPIDANGNGTDTVYKPLPLTPPLPGKDKLRFALSKGRPITGTGMSRRNDAGIPYYRVAQAFNSLMGFSNPPLHSEYSAAGYGGYLYFRGLYYAVDLSDLPLLPYEYRIDYDQISILDLCLEICDVTNHEMFVSLLPITNHPSCSTYKAYNDNPANTTKIGGIIKINTINKNFATEPGSIKAYLDSLNVPIMNKDVGYELTNEPTDKFVTGGQEVKMYYFTRNADTGPEWGMHQLDNSLSQQILPFYGTLGKNIATIPRGYGSYQQIILDAGSLMANGVGKYYVTTEIELRAASVSFEKWMEFLLMYNDIYMESVEAGDIKDRYYASTLAGKGDILELSDNYAVTVPRCVWPPHSSENDFDSNGEPKNPCSPPYGWPLYWHRALNIGIPMAGSAGVSAAASKILKLSNNITTNEQAHTANSPKQGEPPQNDTLINNIANGSDVSFKISNQNAISAIAISDKVSRDGLANAKLVYNFVKKVADECLGKKFLVKIPQKPNMSYYDTTIKGGKNYTGGPFGFPPIELTTYQSPLGPLTTLSIAESSTFIKTMLEPVGTIPPQIGALKVGYNHATGERSFNYFPEPEGGYYEFGLYSTSIDKHLSLAPKDDAFIKTENGRIKPYVRFDHSQIISFSNFSKDSYSQEYLDANGQEFIPDIAYNMENSTKPSDKLDNNAIDAIPSDQAGKYAIAFVKAEVEEEYYFAPPLILSNLKVAGRLFGFKNSITDTHKIFNEQGCKEEDSYRLRIREYYPTASLNNFGTLLTINLDLLWSGAYSPNLYHVYALITLPDRAIPTMTTRFRDGMNMQVNAANIKHYLLLDVVRGMPGLDAPSLAARDENVAFGFMFFRQPPTALQQANADDAIKKAYQGLTFSLTNRINIISPSPVYPDLVALPLRSVERCYGPWLSSYKTDQQVGGKMEFIHDESLTPWNYGGYTLMDRAGRMQAEFGTSNFLMSERGGFTLPIAPSGIGIGKALNNLGPLVTSLSSKIDSTGISTTVTMDLYTASFGKMQKQISDKIKKIGRDRQKIIDERNALLRKNLGKSQKSFSYSKFTKQMQDYLNSMNFSNNNFDAADRGEKQASDQMIQTVQPENLPSDRGTLSANSETAWNRANFDVTSSIQSHKDSEHMMSILSNNVYDLARNYANSVEAKFSDMWTPSSHLWHPFMSSCEHMPYAPDQSTYGDDFSDDDLGNFDPVA